VRYVHKKVALKLQKFLNCPPLPQRKMLVLVIGNKFKIDRQQHNSTSNFVSANSLIAKFIRYVSLCVNASD
jgi:hypothetical protein